jgi:hypothetical protein
MFEHFLRKTPTKEASPAVARKPHHPTKKFSFPFKRKKWSRAKEKQRKFFCWLRAQARRRGCPQFDFEKKKRNSPQTPFRRALAEAAKKSYGNIYFSYFFGVAL